MTGRAAPLLLAALALLLLGIALGGYLFSATLPRTPLALSDCGGRCLRPNELAGLLASAGIQKLPALMPGLLPGIESESAECVAVRHPRPQDQVHYVLLPKHDVRNIAELTVEDEPYVMGCLALAGRLIRRDHLVRYQLHTNGPGLQDVTYLHFHIVGR